MQHIKYTFTPKATIKREKKTRMDMIKKCSEESCIESCEGECYRFVREILQHNRISIYVYADAVRDLLTRDCRKFRNIVIVGPGNCGKIFMLKTLEHIYHVFCNPTNDKYAWAGADQAEVIVLQDLNWSPEFICWKILLLLLEVELVKLPSPKNQFASDVCINKDIPTFAKNKSKIEYVRKPNTRDERETERMNVR